MIGPVWGYRLTSDDKKKLIRCEYVGWFDEDDKMRVLY
jgi:hypothetical protein